MTLTATTVKHAKSNPKPYKLFAEKGLFLLVRPNGGKWWRYKYRYDGKEKLLSVGTYPDVSLKAARESRDDLRKEVAAGVDPAATRKRQRTTTVNGHANTFERVAREWYEKQKATWAESHARTVISRLENDIFPWVGARPIAEIGTPELLATLQRVEDRGARETAHRELQICKQAFGYAKASGLVTHNPCDDLKKALAPVQKGHLAAITDPEKVGPLLRAIDTYCGTFVTRCALRLAPLVFVRPGELRKAEWQEISFENAEWNIPAARMKKGNQTHLVPLSTQAIAILREIQPLTGEGRYVFPSARVRSRPMSNNAVLAALRQMGYSKNEMTGHGFRAMARTILDEHLGFRPDIIEHQLAHTVKDPNGRAYNRTTHLPERRKMAQVWGDYLDERRKDRPSRDTILSVAGGHN